MLTHAENSARQDKPWYTGYFYMTGWAKYHSKAVEVAPEDEEKGCRAEEELPDLQAQGTDPF